MEVPSMLDLDWQRAIREAVRPLIPVDFYGHITVNVQGEHVGDITLYICLRELKTPRNLTNPDGGRTVTST